MKIKIGISNRHVHLTKETYEVLFPGKKIEKRNDLNQVGEFASTDTVDLIYNGKTIEHVRIVGPFRSYNQVELLGSDLELLDLDAPTRRSGNLDNTPGITICTPNAKVNLDKGVIRSERHVHVPTSKEDEFDLHERDVVRLFNDKVSFDAFVKVSDNGYLEVHIDKDEALEYGLSSGDEVNLEKVENR